MRRELGRLAEGEHVELSVGREAIELRRGEHSVQERKVALPIRWIKAFGEVQVYQSQLVRQFEISVTELRCFLATLPRNARQLMYVIPTGKTVRLSQRPAPGGVPLHGAERLRVLQPLLPDAERLVVWLEPESGTSGWQMLTRLGSLFSLVSPELYRGFSGEGQLLEKLAGDDWQAWLPAVQSLLDWQTMLDPAEIAARTGHRVAQVQAALSVLGCAGAGRVRRLKRFLFPPPVAVQLGQGGAASAPFAERPQTARCRHGSRAGASRSGRVGRRGAGKRRRAFRAPCPTAIAARAPGSTNIS